MNLLLNSRVKITLNDGGRTILGQLLAFDKYMNLVVADAEEYRNVKNKEPEDGKQLRRSLGLIVLRGENIVLCSQEAGSSFSGFENKARTPAAQQMAPGMRPVQMPGPGGMTMPFPAMMARPGMIPMMPPGMRQ